MRTVQGIVYKLPELEKSFPAAYRKAIEDNRDIIVQDEFWSECVLETMKWELIESGFYNATIWFTGFGNQGDGACFDATIDIDFFLRKEQFRHLRKVRQWIDSRIVKTGAAYRYSHEHTRRDELSFPVNMRSGKRIDDLLNKLEEQIEAERLRLSRKIYHQLKEIYFSAITDEAVAETLILNECEFFADGRPYRGDS